MPQKIFLPLLNNFKPTIFQMDFQIRKNKNSIYTNTCNTKPEKNPSPKPYPNKTPTRKH